MPIDHMNTGDDPFLSASQVGKVWNPDATSGGRYRLPELTIGPSGELITGTGPQTGGQQRVTTMVKAIGDARALDLWHQRLLIMAMVKRPDLYDLACATVATTPEESMREALESVAGKLLAAVGADEGSNLGTAFHGFTEAQDLGMMHYARRIWHGKLRNYSEGLKAQGLKVAPEYVERKVVVLRYGLAGTLDRIVWDELNMCWVISDLKSIKKFWTWLEISAQLAAYAMADAMWDRAKRCYVEMPPVDQKEGIVAWMPVIGQSGETSRQNTSTGEVDGVDFFSVDLAKGRAALELCHQVDRMRSEAKSTRQTWGLLRPAPGLALVEAFARRLSEVETVHEGSAVWAEIEKAGLTETPELRELAIEVAGRLSAPYASGADRD